MKHLDIECQTVHIKGNGKRVRNLECPYPECTKFFEDDKAVPNLIRMKHLDIDHKTVLIQEKQNL
jgi:hypothetical protein